MRQIKKGTKVTSPYFGDGYIVRTITDLTTHTDYVVIRTIKDRDIVFCRYPHSVNRIFFLPKEFDQTPKDIPPSFRWMDGFTAKYNQYHRYAPVLLRWETLPDPPSIPPTDKSLLKSVDDIRWYGPEDNAYSALVDYNLEDL